MTLDSVRDSLDGLSEDVRSHYVERDGRHHLDVSGMVPKSDLERLQQDLVDTREEAARRRRSLERWRELGESPEAVRGLMSPESKAGRETIAQHKELVESLKADHERQMGEMRARMEGLQLEGARRDLQAALAERSIMPAGLPVLAKFAADRIRLDADGAVRVYSEDGQRPMAGSGSDGYATVADLAGELAASDAGRHFLRSSQQGGGGRAPGVGGAGPSDKQIPRREFESLSAADQFAKIKDGFSLTDA